MEKLETIKLNYLKVQKQKFLNFNYIQPRNYNILKELSISLENVEREKWKELT